MEKILKIEESTFKKEGFDNKTFEGYQIITDKQTIKIGIENGQFCCECWGYLITEDDLSYFENSKLISIDIVDTALKVEKLKELNTGITDTIFVNFNTTKGLLQFVAYNEHNGYYGHDVVIISQQLSYEISL